MRRSATCGSRRGRSRSRTAARTLLPVLVITAAHSRFMLGRMIPTRRTRGPADWGLWSCFASCWAGAAQADLGQRVRHRPRQAARRRRRRVHRHAGHHAAAAASRMTRSPRAWWSAATGSSRPPSCPAGRSRRRPTSTPSSPTGWPSRTPGRCAPSRPGRSTCSMPTGPRCCRCHRWRRRWGGSTGSGWDATTTSASTATTTPSTRR